MRRSGRGRLAESIRNRVRLDWGIWLVNSRECSQEVDHRSENGLLGVRWMGLVLAAVVEMTAAPFSLQLE